MESWSDLVPDLLVEIAVKVNEIGDFMAFRGVCKSWRTAATKDIFRGAPLLMLAENKNDESDEREFYSLSTREIRKAAVPEAKGKRCTDARFGWIVAVAPSGGEVYLFKPFCSSPTIPLPNFHTFPKYREYECNPEVMFVKKAILTANPSDTSDFMVFVLMNLVLGFWKNGDENWTLIETEFSGFDNIGYCGHKMYATEYGRGLWSWDPSAADLTQIQLVLRLDDFLFLRTGGITPYMVESSAGELLLITRDNVRWDEYESEGATYFEVARIDVVKREWEEIEDIGCDAIFLGENATVSINADDFPGVIKPNCIYFTDDCIESFSLRSWDTEGLSDPNYKGGGKDMGIYDIAEGEGSIERFPIESFSPICPPFWVFP